MDVNFMEGEMIDNSKKQNYGRVALMALEKILIEKNNPRSAWKKAAEEVLDAESMRVKNCPMSAFLGLCMSGLIEGIPRGRYTKSILNAEYAVKAVDVLKNIKEHKCGDPSSQDLWFTITENKLEHNGQMDVVLSLWENGYLRQ